MNEASWPRDVIETRLLAARIVPIIATGTIDEMVSQAGLLADAGYDLVEIALRSPSALEAIHRTSAEHPIGVLAGTVLVPAQVEPAVNAGAIALVSPGLAPDVTRAARAAGVPHIPGVFTPSEFGSALAADVRLLKYFPARGLRGLADLQLSIAPFRHAGVTVFPTGGLDDQCIKPYLMTPGVVALGGSWMLAPHGGGWEDRRERTRMTLALARSVVA